MYSDIGVYGSGRFTQTGGTHLISKMLTLGFCPGSTGAYFLGGEGVLTVASGGEIRVGADHGSGRFILANNRLTTPKLTIGATGTLGFGYDFNVTMLSDGSLLPGITLSWSSPYSLEVTNGATAMQSGTTSLSLANLILGSEFGNGSYVFKGTGQLGVINEYVGYNGNGTFLQSGGSHGAASLYLGYASNAQGNYSMQENYILSATNEYVGYNGNGTFTQSGGIHGAASLYIGYASNAQGNYSMQRNSILSVANEYVGYNGNGTFTQSGGSHGAASFYLGYASNAQGNYSMQGNSILSATNEYVGYNGNGTFTQSGGTNTVSNYLYLGYNPGSTGVYNLSNEGSSLKTSYLELGYSGCRHFHAIRRNAFHELSRSQRSDRFF